MTYHEEVGVDAVRELDGHFYEGIVVRERIGHRVFADGEAGSKVGHHVPAAVTCAKDDVWRIILWVGLFSICLVVQAIFDLHDSRLPRESRDAR